MTGDAGVSERLEYAGARALVGAARLLPAAPAQRMGAALGAAAHGFGARRAVVHRQIAAAFPARDDGWVERTARACYRHFGREAAVMVRLQAGDARLLRRTSTDEPTERWIERMAGGEAAIVVAGHLGNWEAAGTYLAGRGVPLSAVVRRQRNRRFDGWLAATRRRLGMEPIYMQDARREVPRHLARGRTTALVADQDARDRGLMVPFLGRPASTFRGPVVLALRTGAPLVFLSIVREASGYRFLLETVREAPGAADGPAGEGDDAELELTARWVGALERRVRERPEQYFWFHRRWKSGRNAAGAPGVPHADPAAVAGAGSRISKERKRKG